MTCTQSAHESGWSSWPSIGIQRRSALVGIDLRNCPACHSTIGRVIVSSNVIEARLTLARANDDVSMVARCVRALAGEWEQLEDAMEMEHMMGGAR